MVGQEAHAATVLVVDNELLVLRLMEFVLVEAGYQVHPAISAIEALRIMDELPSPPSCVVTDLRMGLVDGAELAKRIDSRCPGLPVLFVSGWEPAHPIPGRPLLRKPFRPQELVNAVALLLRSAKDSGQ